MSNLPASTHPFLLIFSPIAWVFGSLYMSVNSLHFYTNYPEAPNNSLLLAQAIFLNLCVVFTLSNVLHMALQLPTASMAVKFQRHAQVVMLGLLSFLLACNIAYLDTTCTPLFRFLMQCTGIYLMLGVGTAAYYCV